MVPIYAEFGVELPIVTQLLIHPVVAILAGIAAISELLVAFMFPPIQRRNVVALLSTTVAILAGVICIYGFCRPLIVLVVSLG
jgi:cytochrome c oxidase assembly factor CtaG